MNLDDLLAVLPHAWEPADRDGPVVKEHPAAGQCLLSSLLIQRHLGGRIMAGEVQGYKHYWNRLENGMWVDATRSQFLNHAATRKVRFAKPNEGIFRDTWQRVDDLEWRCELILRGEGR